MWKTFHYCGKKQNGASAFLARLTLDKMYPRQWVDDVAAYISHQVTISRWIVFCGEYGYNNEGTAKIDTFIAGQNFLKIAKLYVDIFYALVYKI